MPIETFEENNKSKVFSKHTTHAFEEELNRLLQACINFKNAPPFLNSPDTIRRDIVEQFTNVKKNGQPLSELVSEIEKYLLPYCLNFSSPSFIAHNDSGNAVAPIMGDITNAFLQQNLSSFDYSPIASLIEIEILRTIRKLVGYPETYNSGTLAGGGGVMFGGAGANFACLLAAREDLKKKLKAAGKIYNPRKTRTLANRPFSHFSLRRSLYMLGLGNRDLTEEERAKMNLEEESLLDVNSKDFRMDVSNLENKINYALDRGEDIMCIFLVSGDSRMMSFDHIIEVNRIAKKYDIWVHVDACEGGQVLFSPKRRHLMNGVEQADSVSMDPHKTLMIPYNLSLFLLKDVEKLNYVSGGVANVIKQDNNTLGIFTPTINSKSFISLKLLLLLKHWGWESLAYEIERRHHLILKAAEFIRKNSNLILVNPEVQHNAVAFMFWPDKKPKQTLPQLNNLNKIIHQQLNFQTNFFLHNFPSIDDSQVISKEKPTIFPLRIMIGNPLTTWKIIEDCLKKTVEIGHALS